MSFIMDTVKCSECKRHMNVAFGIVGTSPIAEWPTECAFCKAKPPFEKVSGGWHAAEDGGLKEEEKTP